MRFAMRIDELHHQDVRAAIRKKFETIKAFEQAHGFNPCAVHDVLRGRTSRRVKEAIEAVLLEQEAA
jgi:hypothetical protein